MAAAFLTLSVAAPVTAQGLDDGKPVGGAIAGGIARGTFKIVGEAVTEMIRRQYKGSSIIYKFGSGTGSLAQAMEGKAKLAMGFSEIEIWAALNGKKPFKKAYSADSFRVVGRIAGQMELFAVATNDFVKKYKIKTFADIARAKPPIRISVHRLAVMTVNKQAVELLALYGIGPKQVKAWGGKIYNQATRGYTRLMKNRRLDVAFSTTWHPSRKVVELATARGVTFIPFDRPQVDALASKLEIGTATTPASAYKFLKAGYYTTASSFPLIAPKGGSKRLAYKIAKALYNQFGYYQKVHPVFRRYKKSMLAEAGSYKLHPGARQFYKEVGLIK
jgi:TRAP transporter TAXI family solute receptor